MRIVRVLLLLALLGAAGGIALWMGKREEPPLPPDPLRDLAAEFLGADPADLVRQPGPGTELPWNHRDIAVLVTYETKEGYRGRGLHGAWASVAVEPQVIMMAHWSRATPSIWARARGPLDDDRLQAMGAEFLKTHFPPFGDQDVLENAKNSGGTESPIVLLDWAGPGPGDHTHKVQIGLSRVDGAPVRFSAHFRAPAPPPATPIRISEEEARAIAEQVVRERIGDVRFHVVAVATDTPLAEWGQPVYRVVAYKGPLSPHMFGIHATTGEVLELRPPPL